MAAWLALSPTARAQAPIDPEPITFGIGVVVYPSLLLGDLQSKFNAGGFANLIVPIQIGAHIRAEPELGLYLYTADATLPDTVKEHTGRQIVRGGMGVFYTRKTDVSFQWYAGARLGILSSETQVKHAPLSPAHAEFNRNWAGFYAGAALGLEYFLSPHCSVGGEFQLNHVGYGDPVINDEPLPSVDSTQSAWSTNAALTVRLFF